MAVRSNSPQHAAAGGGPALTSPSGTIAAGLALVPSGAHQGKPSLPLTRTFTLIGSRNRAHLHLVSASVSKSHTAVIVTRAGIYVRDLASRTHTIVNGQAQKEVDLRHGDKLTVGNFSFRADAKAFAKAKPGAVAPKASLLVEGSDFPILFEGRSVLIGRRPTCDVPLMEESVSTVHALIFEVDGRHYVRDLGSRTGTLVNGKPVHQHPLNFGDELRVGETTMRFVPEGATEEDYAGGAAALEEELTPAAIEPHPVPDFAPRPAPPRTEDAIPLAGEEDIAAAADEHLPPLTPAAEVVAPVSEADDLGLLPLADEEPAPVGDWGRVRQMSPARPAEPVAEEPREAALAEPAAEEEPLDVVEPIDFSVAEEPASAGAEAPAIEELAAPAAGETLPEMPSVQLPSDDLGLEFAETATEPEPAKAEEPGDLDLSGLSLEPVSADRAAAPTVDESAVPAEHAAAAAEGVPLDTDVESSAPPLETLAPSEEAEEVPAPAPKKSRGGRKKSAAAAAPKEKPAKKEKEKDKGKEAWWGKKRKQQQQAPPAPATEPEAPRVEEPSPIAPVVAAGAAAGAVGTAVAATDAAVEATVPDTDALAPVAESAEPAPPAPPAEAAEERAITGDDLAFLDDLLAAESNAPATVDTPDLLETPAQSEPKLDLSVGDLQAGDAAQAADVLEPPAASTDARPEPVDSLAGLDLSNLATGSGLDLGGVVDSVDLPDEGPEAVLPPDAPDLADLDLVAAAPDEGVAAAAPDGLDLPEELVVDRADTADVHGDLAAQDSEVLEFTEPTPESALDLSIPDSVVGDDATAAEAPAGATMPVDAASLSDTTFGRAVEALGDPSLAPVDETAAADEPEVSGAAASAATGAPAAGTQADGLGALVAEARPSSGAGGFDAVLDELAGGESTGAREPELRFDLAPATDTTRVHEPASADTAAISFDQDDAAQDQFETQADKLIAEAASTDGASVGSPAEETSSIDDVFALDEAQDVPETAAAAAEEPPVVDDLSLDTFAVADPEPAAEEQDLAARRRDDDADQEAPAPLISDLTSATEDEAVPAPLAEEPADLVADDAAEAIRFDLEPAAEAVDVPTGTDEAALEPEAEAVDLDAMSPAERAQWIGPVDEPAPRTDEAGTAELSLNADEAEAPRGEPEARPATPAAAGPSFDPLFGMGRDAGTFIGGMPLPLPGSAAPAEATPAAAAGELSELASKLPPPELIGSADDLPSLEELGLEPPPQQQPAATPVNVDEEVEAIDFSVEPAAGAPPAAPAQEPPAAAAVPPRVVPFNDANRNRVIPKPPPAARNIPPRSQPMTAHTPAWGPFDLGLGDGAVEIPPFNQGVPGEAPKAGPLTTAFDGLALEDDEDRATDNLFAALGGAAADPIFGLPSRPAAPKVGGAGGTPASPAARDAASARPSAQGADQPAERTEQPSSVTKDDDNDDNDNDAGVGGSPPTPSGGTGAEDDLLASFEELSKTESESPGQLDEAAAPAALPAAKPGRGRSSGFTPPAPAEQPAAPAAAAPRKRRRWGIGFLLIFGFISAALAVAAIFLLQPKVLPRTVEVSGYLRFQGLDELTERQRKAEVERQRELLKALPERAREALMGLDPNLDPGFLGGETARDAQAYASIVDSAKVPDKTNKLALYHHGADKDGDPVRMKALLQALYTKNAGMGDELKAKQAALETANAELTSTLRETDELKKQAAAGNKLDNAAVIARQQKVDDLKAKDDALRAESRKARLRVTELEAELERATAAAGASKAPPGATTASAATKDPADDAQLREMTQRLTELTAKLDRTKGAKSAEATAAAQKLNQALSQFDKQIATAQSELKGDDQLSQYVAEAQKTQRQISRIYERLVSQQKEFSELLNAKKASLAEKLQTRIQEAWAADAPLKSMQETLALKERHRNAAAASGLASDVTSLDKQIGDLNAQIEARRELIGTGHASAVDVREQQQFVDKLIQMMEKDRASNDKEMAEVFDNFNKQLPSIEKLPEEQKKLATALAAQSSELNAAREQYLKASATESADDTKSIEAELAQTQAKVEARKRQIADAAAQDLSTQQQQEREFRIAQARTNLEEAKAAWERAEAASSAAYTSWSEAKDEARAAKIAFERGLKDAGELAKLDARRREQLALVEKLGAEVKGKIQPLPVDNDSVSYTLGEDTRPLNAMMALIAIAGIFGTLIYVETHQSEHAGEDEHVPFAAAAYAGEFSEPVPRFADIDEAARAAGLAVPEDPFGAAAHEGEQSVAV